MQNNEKNLAKRTNSFNESTKGEQPWPPRVTIPIKLDIENFIKADIDINFEQEPQQLTK
jgi:hypothetical protein